MKPGIYSEIDPLRLIITHRPGVEHDYMTPENLIEKIDSNSKIIDNPNYLLFDDLIQTSKAKEEHESFYNILHTFTDGNCYELIDLFNFVLKDDDIRKLLIDECITLEYNLYKTKIKSKDLYKLSVKDLCKTLLSGYLSEKQIFKHPIPNLIFTRDIAVCIGKTILITSSAKEVRKRENIIAKYTFTYHPIFKDYKVFNFQELYPELNIEGGDIIIFDNKNIFIGISERTSLKSIKKIAPLIFKEGFKTIITIDMPKKRALMHLDTIFTKINIDEALIYPPILDEPSKEISLFTNSKSSASGYNIEAFKNISFGYIMNKFYTNKINFIKCGSSSKIMQKREQWTDGANAFALSPGKIIGYDCNKYTIKELKKYNYKIIKSTDYLKDYKKLNKSNQKFVIVIRCSELSRGRGGPRCLTLPLFRFNLKTNKK